MADDTHENGARTCRQESARIAQQGATAPLQVIGAGFGRTGTKTLQSVLQILLGGDVYHMSTTGQPENAHHLPLWEHIFRAPAAAAAMDAREWGAIFGACRGAVDFPASLFWPELMAAYPDALVVLTVRDFDSWHASCEATIFPLLRAAFVRCKAGAGSPRDKMARAMCASRFTTDLDNVERLRHLFEGNIREVKARVPAERLLVFDVKQGWAPLCAKLGVPVPEIPFPHINTTAQFRGSRAQLFVVPADDQC